MCNLVCEILECFFFFFFLFYGLKVHDNYHIVSLYDSLEVGGWSSNLVAFVHNFLFGLCIL